MNPKIILAALGMMVLWIGCSKDSTSPMNPSPTSNFTVSPNDGATSVRLDAGITFTFALPINREVVERNVHLISERAMADSLCPVSDSMGHGNMEMAMMDSVKINHLMDRHATQGRFSWTYDNKQCTFIPDSMMMPNMRYMIHMSREMMRMIIDRMGETDMRDGHGIDTMSDEMMYHFQTMDTTSIGGGHEGHH